MPLDPLYDPLWPFPVVVGGYPPPAPETPVNPEIEVVPMNNNYFAIQSTIEPELLWSNTDGWTEGEDFDLFTIDESETLDLPLNGKWVRFVNIIRT